MNLNPLPITNLTITVNNRKSGGNIFINSNHPRNKNFFFEEFQISAQNSGLQDVGIRARPNPKWLLF